MAEPKRLPSFSQLTEGSSGNPDRGRFPLTPSVAWRHGDREQDQIHRHTFLDSATLGRGSAEEGVMSANAGGASRAKATAQPAKTEWWSLTFHLSCPSRAGVWGDRSGVCGDSPGMCGDMADICGDRSGVSGE